MMRPALLALPFVVLATPAPGQMGFDPFHEARIESRPGAQVPLDAPLRDDRGRAVTLREIGAGKPMLLVPVLHRCPNLCGVTLAGIADAVAAQRLRPGRDFAMVALGIDPREGADAAADDLARLRARPAGRALGPVAALTGTAGAIRAVTDAIGYRYAWDARVGQYAHVAATAVLTPGGRLSGWLYGLSPRPGDLGRALADARHERSASWGETLLLLCFNHDPATGRWTAAIDKLLRWAGFATVLGLAALVLRLRRAPG